MKPGDDIILREDQGCLQILTYKQRLERVRAAINAKLPKDVMLSEELLKMRREEASRQ